MTEPRPPEVPSQEGKSSFNAAIWSLAAAMVISVVGCFWLALIGTEIPLALATLTGALVGAVGASIGIRIHESINGRTPPPGGK